MKCDIHVSHGSVDWLKSTPNT